jgi:hypothetical protein
MICSMMYNPRPTPKESGFVGVMKVGRKIVSCSVGYLTIEGLFVLSFCTLCCKSTV